MPSTGARERIVHAFNHLFLSTGGYDEIGTGTLIERSGVARSTFYAHFANKEDVLLAAAEPLLAVLARLARGDDDRASLRFLLDHFWQNRNRARLLLSDRTYFQLCAKLAAMIAAGGPIAGAEDGESVRAAALGRAAGMLGLVRGWLAGEVGRDSGLVAEQLLKLAAPPPAYSAGVRVGGES